jgi:hypothetical protein
MLVKNSAHFIIKKSKKSITSTNHNPEQQYCKSRQPFLDLKNGYGTSYNF